MTKEQETVPKKYNHSIPTLLRYFITVAAIAFIVYSYRDILPNVLISLKATDLHLFSISIIIFFVGLIFIAIRLMRLLKALNIHLSLWHNYLANLIFLFINNIFPTALGGELIKALYVYKKTGGRKDSFGTVFVDRLLGLVTLSLIGIVAVVFIRKEMLTAKVFNSITFLACFTFLLAGIIFSTSVNKMLRSARLPFVSAGLSEKLKEIYEVMHQYRNNPQLILQALGLSLIAQFFFIMTSYTIAQSLDISIHLSFFFFFVPIFAILTLAPSINGIGIREATFLFYLSDHATPEKILAFSFLTTIHLVLVGIICGIFYGFFGGKEISNEPLAGSK